jgi:uncharacterized membrane protein YesL
MRPSKKFMDWYLGSNNNTEKEPPRSGLKRVGYVLLNYTGKLVVINVIFLLCCIPVITIPAALTALNRYLIQIFRVGYGASISDYVNEMKANILKSIPLGLLSSGAGIYAYYLMSLSNNFVQTYLGHIVMGFGWVFFLIFILFGSYSFVLLAMLDLSVVNILKNSLILMAVEWKTNLKLIICFLGITGFIGVLLPYSIIPALLAGASVNQLVICSILNPVVNKRIIEPFERTKI